MKKLLFITLLFLAVHINANAEELQKFELKVNDFTELRLTDHLNVVYSENADSIGYAHFESSSKIANMIMFKNNNGKLTIQLSTDGINEVNLPTVYIYSKFLQSAENASDSTLKVINTAPIPNIKFKLSANGKIIAHNLEATAIDAAIITGKGLIVLSGNCKEARLKNVGTGEIQADKLTSDNVSCAITGTGSIGCNVKEKLTVKGTGTGKVYYVGNPKEVKTYKLGPIKVIPLDNK